ncbi:MAG TPA: hypothetical protein VK797_24905 [Tepidisphaeraceae bacterium]|jgi:hypothetical protein|nr:hypothetical protein [Tepidisphaeraceae bacterium]
MSPLSDLVSLLSGRRSGSTTRSQSRRLPAIEPLEDRRLLSIAPLIGGASPALMLGPTPISVPVGQGVTLHEKAGVSFTASVGTFVTLAPGTNLHAYIRWGDGTSSQGVVKSDGVVGLDEIKFEVDGTHTYHRPGTFPINVTVYQSGPPGSLAPIRLITTIKSSAIVAGKNVALDGTITGKYSLAPVAAIFGGGYVFNGTGTAGDLGAVSAHGVVFLGPPAGPLPIPYPIALTAIGTLTLTSTGPSAGASTSPVLNSVTLALSPPPTITPASTTTSTFPPTLHYVITSGTGMFAGVTGTGSIAVTLNPDMTFSFVMTSTAPPSPVV